MKYYCDGFIVGSKLDHGGYSIVDENNQVIKREEIFRDGFTVSESEVLGILNTARIAGIGDQISTDSICALTWVHCGKSSTNKELYADLQEAKRLIEEKKINLMWERRDFNLAGIYNEKEKKKRNARLRRGPILSSGVAEAMATVASIQYHTRTLTPIKGGFSAEHAAVVAANLGNALTEEEMFPPAERNKKWVDTYLGKVRLQ